MRETASKEEVQSQQSWCSLCELIYGGKQFTDELWLRTIRGRDYLVCTTHKEIGRHGKTKNKSR